MTESNKYEPPKPSKQDNRLMAIRDGLSPIPYGAEIFARVVTPPLERRLEKWREDVGEALRNLEENQGVSLEELQSDEGFIDTVLQATEVAIRTSQQEKREALRNAILNAALPNPPEQSLQQMFLSFIDTFTVWHIRLLKLFHNVRRWAEENGHRFPEMRAGSLSNILESAYPELGNQRELYDQIWRDLHQRGLVGTESLHTTMGAQGLIAKQTLKLGSQFLRFIEEPE
jgi:hypothetical protein